MLDATQLRRSAVVAVVVAALGTGTALARPADVPLRPDQQGQVATPATVAPRVESIGVSPATAGVVAVTPAPVALTKADDSGGLDWTSIGIGAAALLALLALGALAVSHRPHFRHIGPQA